MLGRDELLREASAAGFQPESLEKALRLLDVLQGIRSHPFLKSRVALKGGTALNLFVFDVPRLSVDIDLNYIGASDRETMLAERPKVDESIQAVCGRLGLQVKRVPTEHAGGKWRVSYQGSLGRPVTLELDMNFMLRSPLWPVSQLRSRDLAGVSSVEFPVVDQHELAAGKLAALLGRQASRDVFDAHRLLKDATLDRRQLRQAFVVYGGCNRRDWREVSADVVGMSPVEAERKLLPLLRTAERPRKGELGAWTERLVGECRDLLAVVLPLSPPEVEFLTRLNAGGEVAPELLTDDPDLQAAIGRHPMLAWKAQNVREHRRHDR